MRIRLSELLPPSQDRVKGSGKGGEKRVELRGVSQKSTISTGTRRGGSGAELTLLRSFPAQPELSFAP